jgi:nucleoside-diphosphate-sugar epimerase
VATAFVTGGTGFLGLHLVEQLSAAGWRVVALHRKSSNLTILSRFEPELVLGSINDRDSLRRGMPEEVDAVFHVAGNTSLWSGGNEQQTRDNVDGTRNVVEVAIEKKARRFVQTSSQSAWGHQDVVPFDENAPSHALESSIHYDRTKYLGELEVEKGIEHGLHAVLMNPGHIIGRYDAHNWSRMISLIVKGKLPGVPPGSGTFADAREVARAHIASLEKGRVGERYLLGGVDASYLEMVRIIGELTGVKVPKKTLPLFAIVALGRVSQWGSYFTKKAPVVTPEIAEGAARVAYFKSDKAIRELGYHVVPLEESLRECYEWMKSEGMLSR